MPPIPRDPLPDVTIQFRRNPYRFIRRRCRRHGADLFESRLLFRPTIFMTGPEAATIFYDRERFERADATPGLVGDVLFGRRGVQGLDGEAHLQRKAMFMSVMHRDALDRIAGLFAEAWTRHFAASTGEDRVLYQDAREILTRTACAWAGVPLSKDEAARRTNQLGALYEGAGSVGIRYFKGRRARARTEHWAAEVVKSVRTGRIDAAVASPVSVVSNHREPDGQLLEPRVAAVELLNLLRPIAAVSVYVAFLAHALHAHTERSEQLATDDAAVHPFVQEVRRFYPFFPAVVARVRRDFDWNGYRFPTGRRAVLDIDGTNRDPRIWDQPEAFRPERFGSGEPGPFDFIPQGGGDHNTHHRCAGEWITIRLMETAVRLLTRGRPYRLPRQDLSIDMRRLPALPRSGVLMRLDVEGR